MNDKQRKEAMKMVAAGIPASVVGRKFGVSRQYISAEAKRRGITRPSIKTISKKLWKTFKAETSKKE